MGVFFAPQAKKLREGYYINHDNIAALSPVDRKRMITFFIAMQTNEKLNPIDRELFLRTYWENVRKPTIAFSGLVTVISPALYYKFWSKYQPRYGLRFFFYSGMSAVVYNFFATAIQNIYENRMLQSDLTLKLAYKYNFTLFDFAQAKKESHLKHLRGVLLDETHVGPLFVTPQ